MRVKQIMSTEVVSMDPKSRVEDVAQVMAAREIGFIPVVTRHGTREELTGVVTDRDVLVRALAKARQLKNLTLQDCMTEAAVACEPNDTIDLVLHLMATSQVRRLPVINEYKEVEGIITLGDIVRNEAASPKQIASVLRRIYAHRAEPATPAKEAA